MLCFSLYRETQNVYDAYEQVKKPVLVDDTSLYINSLNRLPGALTKWFLKAIGNEGIVRMIANEVDKTATAETTLAYYDGKDLTVIKGSVHGMVVNPRGENGFG